MKIDDVFSKEIADLLESTEPTTLNNIDKEFHELITAACSVLEDKTILWIVGENENLPEKKQKLRMWLNFLAPRRAETNICFYTTPFEDPYINNSENLNAAANKAKLIAALLNRAQGDNIDSPGLTNGEAAAPAQDKEKTASQPAAGAIVVCTLSALSIKIEPREQLRRFFLDIRVEGEINREQFTGQLMEMGYRARNIVEEKGDTARRGSIFDVFPIDGDHPVRIEIEGEQVVSMRFFDPGTQKSIKKIDSLLFPAARYFLDYGQCKDYFGGGKEEMVYLPALLGNHKIIVSDEKKIKEEFAKLLDHFRKIYQIASAKGEKIEKVENIFTFPLEKEKILNIDGTFDAISGEIELQKLPKSIADFDYGDIGAIKDKIENRGKKLFVFSPDDKIEETLKDNFANFVVVDARIPVSFENKKTGCLFLTDRNYQYFEKFDRLEKLEGLRESRSENLVKEIRVNDFVVHRKHGIGRFTGFKRMGFGGELSEFLKIEYLNREFLYVPVYELDALSKYIAFEGAAARLDKLGGNSWAMKQKRAKKSIITFARELLDLYAVRKSITGSSYYKDSELEDRLEESFRFVETGDQKRAIKEVLNDLEAQYPMDRLICGDVSFGKTEVALRAALRVVVSGRQVAFLCPTTILAHQHYTTFKKRFAQFPINIVLLSRMVSLKEKKAIYKDLAQGKIDIVIGTHALLAKDIVFSSLGLYIIDEEQRFGVFQKEKLKKNREDIDVLSLSATPIPRTLSLSMAGLQDISTIQTPPIGRLAIKNYVGYFSKEVLTSAVLNEIERQGLVFIVYNNINKIYTFKEDVETWLPGVPVAVIHAKMRNEDIEKNLLDFIDKKFRVLLSTTIIENGIDIPDVNTLIVVDADRFGLTQLYQLRGRIGRGNRQAFAYFLVKSGGITDQARSRLEAIREFADLGSGYRLAEFDLKLRGAGSLLGNRQHGHIEALGFDYYHQMLNKTIKELKGDLEKKEEPGIVMNFSYSIDPNYIKDSVERISFYRRILEAGEFEQIDELRAELNDRYGRMPESIEKIFYAGFVRVLVRKLNLKKAEVFLDRLVVTFAGPDEAAAILAHESFRKFKPEEVDESTVGFSFKDYTSFMEAFKQYLFIKPEESAAQEAH